jgi:hypothetical protein
VHNLLGKKKNQQLKLRQGQMPSWAIASQHAPHFSFFSFFVCRLHYSTSEQWRVN